MDDHWDIFRIIDEIEQLKKRVKKIEDCKKKSSPNYRGEACKEKIWIRNEGENWT